LEERRRSNEARIAEATQKTRSVQNKLLALVGETNNCVDLDSDDDASSHVNGPPLSGSGATNTSSTNANLQPLGPRKGRSMLAAAGRREPVGGVFDDEVMKRLKGSTEEEQNKILKQFNIVRIDNSHQPPAAPTSVAKNIIEIDLIGDTDEEDDLGMYSDGSVQEENVTQAPGKAKKSDQELVNEIVRADLESVRASLEGKAQNEEDDDEIEIL